ncbi:MAG TPA: hypothetical protein VJB99_03255 [Patescibacteria group bacterium]|nr:hypothetical protein [Patescibacteria group bacterium]
METGVSLTNGRFEKMKLKKIPSRYLDPFLVFEDGRVLLEPGGSRIFLTDGRTLFATWRRSPGMGIFATVHVGGQTSVVCDADGIYDLPEEIVAVIPYPPG